MEKTKAKKAITEKAVKKGFYVITTERRGAGPPKDDKYTESERSYYARWYMQINSAQSTAEKDD